MASTDARPVPIKNTAFRAVFPIYDADGDLVTGAATLDSEVSKDQGAFADCTNEATEIATSSGIYYLDLTATEMNADCVAVIVKTGTAGAKTTVLVFYPEETGDINVDVTAYGGAAGTFSGGRPEVNTTHAAGTAWASGAITSGVFATGAITAGAIAADAIGASELAADAVAEIADAVWDEDATGHQTQGTFGQAIGDPVADTNTIYKAVVTDATGATVGADTTEILADTADMQPKLGTPAGASISADIAAIEAQTDDIGVAGAGLTAIPWNAAWDAEVESEANDALVAQNLDHLVKIAVDTNFATTVHLDSVVGHLADAGVTATFDRTTDALEVLGAVTVPSAASIADAVWEEAIADHSGTAGSTAEQLAAAGAAGDPWATAVPGAYGAGTAGKILGDNLNATVSSRASQTSVDTVDTVADAIKAKTDSLTFTVAGSVDANIQHVNDTAVTGDGQAGTEWGPA